MGEIAITFALFAIASAIRDAGVRISDAITKAKTKEGQSHE